MTIGLRGLYPAALLPLRPDLSIAERDFIVQVQHLARAGVGVGGVIVNDPAGDAAGLSPEERARVLELAISAAPVGFPVIASVQDADVAGAAVLVEDARARGAGAALVYPLTETGSAAESSGTSDGLLRAITELAQATELPLVVAQTRGDGHGCYSTEELVELARLDRVVGIVSAVGDLQLYSEQHQAVGGAVPTLVAVDGPDLRAMLLAGAEGAVVSVSNVVTRAWAEFVAEAVTGRTDATQEWYDRVGRPLLEGLGGSGAAVTANVKHALLLLGLLADDRSRPPLPELSDEERASVRQALEAAGLLLAQ